MTHEDCFYLGKITRLHGYKGAMVLYIDADDPTRYYTVNAVYVELNGQLIPHFIQRADPKANQVIVTFEGVDGEEAAQRYVNKAIYLPISTLPKLSGKQFYYHEVIGFTITDLNFGVVGQVKAITDHPTNPLFMVDHQGKEVLIPMNDDCLVEINRDKGIIVVDTPEGLIDLYLGSANERPED
jgi:16S rRNA processing protein RimM